MRERFHLNNPDRSKWYIATAAACLGFNFAALLILIVFAVWEFRKNTENKNTAILYSALGALIFAMTYFVLFAAGGVLFETVQLLYLMVMPQTICAILLFPVYAAHTRFARRHSRCLSLIQNDHITSLDELGAILGLNEKQLKQCIQRLIRDEKLPGASFDEASREVRFTRSIWAKQRLICKNCGAALTVDFGRTLVCEFCGQALHANRN